MSRTVEQRVVEMRFDNAQFEKNVSTSMSTLEKLRNALSFKGASKGLEDFGKSTGVLTSSIQTVQSSFSALEVIGVTALANITNSAVNAGKQIVKSLTIDPVQTGFQEYELKMGSVQTIMAATGESLETVNGYLEELNHYADKTIYSFSDMTTNIGKFTNAGVKLDDAVMAMKGISNEAAVSGANAMEASRAMYNLAQSLSMGYVQYIDWKSIENANMATVEFKKNLVDTAIKLGVVKDLGNGMYDNGKQAYNLQQLFKDGMKDQWLTTDVLIGTLKDYADETTEIGKKAYAAAQDVKTFSMMMDTLREAAQSGWANTWELFTGDFTEAKSFYTEMSSLIGDFLDAGSDSRNSFLADLMDSSWQKLNKQIIAAGGNVDDFKTVLTDTVNQNGGNVDKLIEKYGSLEAAINAGAVKIEDIRAAIGKYVDSILGVAEVTGEAVDNFKELGDVVDRVIMGDFGNGADRVKALTEAGYDFATVQGLVNQKLLGTEISLESLSDEQLKNVGYTEEQIKALRTLQEEANRTGSSVDELLNTMNRKSGRQLLLESIKNTFTGILTVLKLIRTAFGRTFFSDTTPFRNALESLHAFTEKFAGLEDNVETCEKLTTAFQGLFSIIHIIGTVFGRIASGALRLFNTALGRTTGGVLNFTSSVGGSIVQLDNWITKNDMIGPVFDKLNKLLEKGINKMHEWFEALQKNKLVADVLTATTTAWDEFLTKVEDGESPLKAFWDMVNNISVTLAGFNLQNVVDNITAVATGLGGIATLFNDTTWSLDYLKTNFLKVFSREGTTAVLDSMSESTSTLNDNMKGLGQTISDKIAGIDWSSLAVVGASVLSLTNLWLILQGINRIITLLDIPAAIKNISNALSGMFRAIGKAANIMSIALAIFLLAKALKAISEIDSDKIMGCVVAVIALMGAFGGLYAAMSFISNKLGGDEGISFMRDGNKVTGVIGQVVSFGIMVAAMAGALLVAAKALETVKDMSWPQYWDALKKASAVCVLLLGVAAAMAAVEKVIGTTSLTAGVGLLGFVASLYLMVMTLKKFADLDMDTVAKALARLIPTIGLLTVISIAAGKSTWSMGVGMLGMVAGLLLLCKALKKIDEFHTDSWPKLIGKLVLVVGTLAGLCAVANIADITDGTKVALAAVGLAGALLILSGAMEKLGQMDNSTLKRGGAAIIALGIAMSAMLYASGKAGSALQSAGIIIALVAGMVALTGELIVLSMVPFKKILPALAAMGGLMVALASVLAGLGALMTAVGKSGTAKGMWISLIPIVIALGAFVGAIWLLTKYDYKTLIGAGVGLAGAIMAFGGALKLLDKVDLPSITDSLQMAFTAFLLLLPIMMTMGVLAGYDFASLVGAGVGIGLCLMALAGALKILGTISTDIKSMGAATLGLLGACVGLIAIAFAIRILTDHVKDADAMIAAATSLSMVFLALGSTIAILGVVGAIAQEGLLIGVAALVAGILGIALIIGVVVAVCSWASSQYSMVEKGLDMLVMIANKLGDAISSFIQGFTSNLPQIAQDISDFANNLKPFIEVFSTMPENTGTAMANFAAGMAALFAVGLWTQLADFFNGPWMSNKGMLAGLGEELSNFGDGVKAFGEKTKDITPNKMTAMAELMGAVANMSADMDAKNLGAIAKKQTLTLFGGELSGFGEKVAEFCTKVAGADLSNAQNGANAAKAVLDIANNLPKDPGVFSKKWSFEEFGDNMVNLGTKIKEFSDNVTGINTESVNAGLDAVRSVVTVADEIGNLKSGRWLSAFVGDTNMADFSTNIVALGQAVKNFWLTTVGVKSDQVATACESVTQVIGIADAISKVKSGQGLSWLEGDTNVGTFARNISSLADCVANFAKKGVEIDRSGLITVIQGVKSLINALSEMSGDESEKAKTIKKAFNSLADTGIDDFVKSFTGAEDKVMNAVNEFFVYFDQAVEAHSEDVGLAMSNVLTACVDNVTTSLPAATAAGMNFMNAFNTGVDEAKANVSTSVLANLDASLTEITNRYESFRSAGSALMSYMNTGVLNGRETLNASALSLIASVLNTIKGKFPDFNSSGKNIDQQIANGMNTNRQVAVSMATSLAQSIIAAIRHELDNANLSVTITAKLDTGSVQAEIGRIQAQVQQAMASAAQAAQANAGGTTINYNQTINTTKRVSETATYRGARAAMASLRS